MHLSPTQAAVQAQISAQSMVSRPLHSTVVTVSAAVLGKLPTLQAWLWESSLQPWGAPATPAWPGASPTCSSLPQDAASIAASALGLAPASVTDFGGRRHFWMTVALQSDFFVKSVAHRHRVTVAVAEVQSHAFGSRSRTGPAMNSWWLPSEMIEKSYKLVGKFEY